MVPTKVRGRFPPHPGARVTWRKMCHKNIPRTLAWSKVKLEKLSYNLAQPLSADAYPVSGRKVGMLTPRKG